MGGLVVSTYTWEANDDRLLSLPCFLLAYVEYVCLRYSTPFTMLLSFACDSQVADCVSCAA
jgi:hypothetical protein